MGLGDVDFSAVVYVEFSPGSWEEFGDVCLHLGLGDLLGNKEDFSTCLLGTVLVEDLLSSWDSSCILDWDGVVVENVIHNIVFVGTEVSR